MRREDLRVSAAAFFAYDPPSSFCFEPGRVRHPSRPRWCNCRWCAPPERHAREARSRRRACCRTRCRAHVRARVAACREAARQGPAPVGRARGTRRAGRKKAAARARAGAVAGASELAQEERGRYEVGQVLEQLVREVVRGQLAPPPAGWAPRPDLGPHWYDIGDSGEVTSLQEAWEGEGGQAQFDRGRWLLPSLPSEPGVCTCKCCTDDPALAESRPYVRECGSYGCSLLPGRETGPPGAWAKRRRPTCCRVFGGVKDVDWGSSTYRTSVSELREADRRMGQYAAGRREHGVSWDLADPEPEEDELGLPTTAGMLAPALTAEQQEEGRRWAAQDAHYDYEDEMFDDHGGDYGRGDDY